MTDYLVPQIRRSINQLVDLERIIWCLLFSLAGVAVTCDAESLVALYLPTQSRSRWRILAPYRLRGEITRHYG